MRICLICVEIFAWGKYGGFGRATRAIGSELVKRGHEVYAVVPRRQDQKPVEDLDGIKVFSFPKLNPFEATNLFKKCNADIYHSQEPSFNTWRAMKAMPQKKHVVTARDPRKLRDWWIEFQYPSSNKLQVMANQLYEDNVFVHTAVRRCDRVFAAAKCLIPKVREKYRLHEDPGFLPTPVAMSKNPQKSAKPTVCFLGRLDQRKRPEVFLELATKFPGVKFIMTGEARDKHRDQRLRETFAHLPNITMQGFIDQFESDRLSHILDESWVLISTASREGLPTSFLEALAHKCSILSYVNPEEIPERFGCHTKDYNFSKGLEALLTNDAWKEKGEKGFQYVQENYEIGKSIARHLKVYQSLLTTHTKRT